MPRALKIILVAEIVLGALWTLLAAMAQGAGGLAVFGLFLIVYAIFAVFFVVALYAFWKYPQERERAGWIMALPIVFWFLPGLIRVALGGHLTPQLLVTLLAVAAVAALMTCIVAPRKAVAVVPDFLLQSRIFNGLIFTAVLLGWLIIVFSVVWVASGNRGSGYQGDTGYGLGYAIVLASLYLVGLGFGSFFTAVWGWLGLRGGVADTPRGWHIAQLVIAAPGIIIGGIVLTWLAGQGLVG